ncbi:unnamed protein product [Ceutorhynchus assimilis]|uniref:Peptidase S1 domain-containing protein n=1 Tax=Ceutorhynchus assimilis TaxID=467358 RepID=A0A9N9MXW6_9CUCU|nr:unnamed protein product [Ceutorhynchus assimilis]
MCDLFSKLYILIIYCIFFLTSTAQDQKCGHPLGSNFTILNERIVGGYDVGYYRYPWYAALMQDNQVTCGGALIGPKTVITAAHCYKEYLSQVSSGIKLEHIYTVRLGMYNICTTEPRITEFKVQKVQVHELYQTKKPYFDICLLTLANSTDTFEPLCLPKDVVTTRPREASVPGMGTLKYQGGMPCTLHEARILIYPDSTCGQMINSTGNKPDDIKNAFCAGYLAGGIDTCQGDSGGPLQIVDENGRYILLGIVSFGFRCAVPGYLGMYTDVSQFIKWIKNRTDSTDISFVNSVANNSQESGSDGHKKKKKHSNHEHSNKTPLRIIILRNKKHNGNAFKNRKRLN